MTSAASRAADKVCFCGGVWVAGAQSGTGEGNDGWGRGLSVAQTGSQLCASPSSSTENRFIPNFALAQAPFLGLI